ncbi:hypothetical protein BZA77DRAFT_99217 [Pyronema omphalodes]|nr:hypothetical protein BZA77DRAFT_99217 [Pyronema omphalodes]
MGSLKDLWQKSCGKQGCMGRKERICRGRRRRRRRRSYSFQWSGIDGVLLWLLLGKFLRAIVFFWFVLVLVWFLFLFLFVWGCLS